LDPLMITKLKFAKRFDWSFIHFEFFKQLKNLKSLKLGSDIHGFNHLYPIPFHKFKKLEKLALNNLFDQENVILPTSLKKLTTYGNSSLNIKHLVNLKTCKIMSSSNASI